MSSDGARRKPIILLSARHTVRKGPQRPEQTRVFSAYYDAVTAAGGLPIIAPPLRDPADVGRLPEQVDGLLLTGGYDLRGRSFGEPNHPRVRPMTPRREAFELALARAALDRQRPILAICLGIQVLNVAAGGTLHQHLPDAADATVQHRARGLPRAHVVLLEPDSLAAKVTGTTRLTVNSTHHQAVNRLGDGLVVSGRCEKDGTVEAIEVRRRDAFVLGVQWHPERLIDQPPHLALFRGLVAASASGV